MTTDSRIAVIRLGHVCLSSAGLVTKPRQVLRLGAEWSGA